MFNGGKVENVAKSRSEVNFIERELFILLQISLSIKVSFQTKKYYNISCSYRRQYLLLIYELKRLCSFPEFKIARVYTSNALFNFKSHGL